MHLLLKKLFVTKSTREITLSWLASFLQLNEGRTAINVKDPQLPQLSMRFATDGLYGVWYFPFRFFRSFTHFLFSRLMNLLHVLLLFCQPFLDPKAGKISSIQSAYLASPRIKNSEKRMLSVPSSPANSTASCN
jgi:hypothetical protein